MSEEAPLIGESMSSTRYSNRVYHHQLFQQASEKLVHALALIAIFLVVAWFYDDGFSWETGSKLVFNWHPVLMTGGLVSLFAESAIAYRSLKPLQQQQKKRIHLILHTTILVLTIVGLRAVFRFHNEASPPIKNLYSLHSWLGLVTVILFFAQYAAGVYVFFFPRMKTEARKDVLPYHAYIGTGLFCIMVTGTVLMGIMEKMTFVKACNDSEGNMTKTCKIANSLGIVTVLLSCAVYFTLLEPHKSLSESAARLA
mmetsp:Transcript_4655/g.5263  ORF Transcript_4655/g.5263 Transcript_4655/m.5263 type:complete len:255 (-) Transcript_4655:104-868(-)